MTTKHLIKESDLTRLKDNAEVQMNSLFFEGLVLTIYREVTQMNVLGIPTLLYSTTHFKVRDNADTAFPVHDVTLSAEEMVDYVVTLLQAPNLREFNYIRSLKSKGLQVGNQIEFEDGKKALIVKVPDSALDSNRNLYYIPLKKDGSLSQIKPRVLYGNTKYSVVK